MQGKHTAHAHDTGVTGTISRTLGLVLCLHLLAIIVTKIQLGTQHDMLWHCHAMLGVAAFGFLLSSPLLLATALIGSLVAHTLWVVDCIIGVSTGVFPLAMTNHVVAYSPWQWVLTTYHFYTVPLLLWALRRQRQIPILQALLLTTCVFIALSAISRSWPERYNLNAAYYPLGGTDTAAGRLAQSLPAPTYLVVLNLTMLVLAFLPGAAAIRAWTALTNQKSAEGAKRAIQLPQA